MAQLLKYEKITRKLGLGIANSTTNRPFRSDLPAVSLNFRVSHKG